MVSKNKSHRRHEISQREHLKVPKKTVVGWRSLCGASERLAF